MLNFNRDAIRIQVQKFGGPGGPAGHCRKFSVDPNLTSLEVLQSILTRAFDVRGDYALSYLAVDDTGEQTYLPLLSDWDLEAAFTSASDPCLHLILNARSRRKGGAPDARNGVHDDEDDDDDVVVVDDRCRDYEPVRNRNLAVNSTEWDVVHSVELPQPVAEVTSGLPSNLKGQEYLNATLGIPADPETLGNFNKVGNKLPGLIKNRVEKTYNNIVQGLNKAFSLVDIDPLTIGGSPVTPIHAKEPLSDAEFHSFLDPVGCLVHSKELRAAVFRGGIDPSLRKVVWKHILNVYPEGMPGRQRMDYIKSLSAQYESLKGEWKAVVDMSTSISTPPAAVSAGPGAGSTAHSRATAFDQIVVVANMVRKDVLRTDRTLPFFAGADDNPNTTSLFNILTTFALGHPSVGYCQGMSDLAAPLLFVMRDEAQAYICFCALMRRLKPNFSPDGVQMAQLFAHLSRAVMAYDPQFYQYLCDQQADDLLFCYRWLLLELKREFSFEDALRMLEVSWSSMSDWATVHPGNATTTTTISDGNCTETSASDSACEAYLPLYEKRFTAGCVTPNGAGGGEVTDKSSSVSTTTTTTAATVLLDSKQTPYARVRAMRRQSTHGATVALLRNRSNHNHSHGYVHVRRQDGSAAARGKKTTSLDSSSLEILATGEFECAGTARTNTNTGTSAASSSVETAATCNFVFNGVGPPPQPPPASSSSPEIISSSEVLVSYSPYEIIPSPQPPQASSSSVEVGAEAMPSSPPTPPPPAPTAAAVAGARKVRNLKEFLNLAKPPRTDEELTSSTNSTSSGRGFEASGESTSSGSTSFSAFSGGGRRRLMPLPLPPPRATMAYANSDEESCCEGRRFLPGDGGGGMDGDEDEDVSAAAGCQSDNSWRKEDDDDGDVENHHDDDLDVGRRNRNGSVVTSTSWPHSGPDCDSGLGSRSNTTSGGTTGRPSLISSSNLGAIAQQKSEDGTSLEDVVAGGGRRGSNVDASTSLSPAAATSSSSDSGLDDDDRAALFGQNSCEEVTEATKMLPTSAAAAAQFQSKTGGRSASVPAAATGPAALPPPRELGCGHPFLVFLCLTLLLQHRDVVVKRAMDYNELAMYFDKMVRRHNVARVLNQARAMYDQYVSFFAAAAAAARAPASSSSAAGSGSAELIPAYYAEVSSSGARNFTRC